jgi:hypothetical protein
MRELVAYLNRAEAPPILRKIRFKNGLERDKASRLRAEGIVRVIEAVLDRYFALPIRDIGRVDVAEFFSVAHMLADTPYLFGQLATQSESIYARGQPSPATLFSDLAAVTRSYFFDIGKRCRISPDLSSLVATLNPDEDVVVNFNWDEEVDVAVDDLADGIGYTVEAAAVERNVLVLKPHGSIQWHDVSQGIGNREMYFIARGDGRIPRAKLRVVSYVENELPLDIDRRAHSRFACPPVITPPTFSKKFEYPEQQSIWQDTVHVCGRATEFVFLGYSLPRDDYLTRAAIRSALRDNTRGGQRRCLIIDRAFDDKRANFESVFGGLTSQRNFLNWDFGTSDRTFAEQVCERLKRASIDDHPALGRPPNRFQSGMRGRDGPVESSKRDVGAGEGGQRVRRRR